MQEIKNRWTIHKIGLVNFWYYDEQEFVFSNGKLLLRGSNGSGKSVTMQSFIPLLFDGNKSPERLDPFGSRARKIENYLLGEEDNQKSENTGYLYMEFIKPETGIYMTIGMGLRAKRGKPLEFWGFSISDGRRIGSAIQLYKNIGEKIPLSKVELRNRIGDGGEVIEGQRDYMSMVNRLLYGYEDIEEYEQLIKLLVQIRTPKLSKEFRPSVIYEIMNNSLQPLSDDDLRPLSEAIENMDKIKDQLELLKLSQKAAEKLKTEYSRYNRYVLFEKAQEYINAAEKTDAAIKEETELKKQSEDFRRIHLKAEEERSALLSRSESLEHKKQQLEQHDAFKAKKELSVIEMSLKELDNKKKDKDRALEAKRDKEKLLNIKLAEAQTKKDEQQSLIFKKLDEMRELAEEFNFEEHEFTEVDIKNSIGTPFDFNLLKKDADRYRSRIVTGRKAIHEMNVFEHSYDTALKELEQAKKAREDGRRDVEKADTLLAETKEEFVEKIYIWEKSNKLLKISGEQLPKLVRTVNSYGVDSEYDDIRTEARVHYVAAESLINKDILLNDSKKAELIQIKKQKTDELNDWKNKKDPEPQREAKTTVFRNRLEKARIPFIPFYKAVDFNEAVPEEVRGRIEEALSDMGILDALIISEKYLDKLPDMPEDAADKYIIPNPQFLTQELSQLLKPIVPQDCAVSFQDIDNVLKSILLDKYNSSTYIDENGNYCVGILSGATTSQYSAKYLGAEARKRYRREIMDILTAELVQIENDISLIEQIISELKQKMLLLNSEFDAFPGKADLETALKCLTLAAGNLEAREAEAVRKQGASDRIYVELKQARDKVREVTINLNIPLTLKDYEDAENLAAQYKDMLLNLETIYSFMLNMINSIAIYEDQMDELLNDIDSIWEDIRIIKRDIETGILKKNNLEAVLQQSDYESIKKEIEECIYGLAEIPEKLEAAIRTSQTNQEHYTGSLAAIEKIKRQSERYSKITDICMESFLLEYKLGYVFSLEEKLSNISIAKKVYTELKSEEKSNKFRDDYTTQLHDKYRENSQYLTEYNLRIDIIFDNIDGEENQQDIEIARLLAKRRRSELCAKVQGKDADFFTMLNFVEQAIEENERLLKESDRQLFEDILANTVGKKIRGKIYHSEVWVKKINALMESMDTSSGLSFSLIWRNKVAENEEQLGTKELVHLLQTDAVLLTEEDMGKLTAHFRSKIMQARKSIEDTGSMQSFHIIMKDILDYRKWFEFQLLYKKTNENRRELTDNAFFKFSGGEKAMAMYVPLFSSVYARYDGARKDCPRVISLDEAFAGVDENNIRDMFRLVDELGLDYVINSQVLWGDYDTVPSLSVYELLRPNNADFVSTIRYQWNGKVRTLIMENEDGKEAV